MTEAGLDRTEAFRPSSRSRWNGDRLVLQRLIPVIIACGAILATTAGAVRAQRFDDRDRHERFEHEHWERERWERLHGYGRPYVGPGYYAPPPVYYAPPQTFYPPARPYYAPPPIYQTPGYGFVAPFR